VPATLNLSLLSTNAIENVMLNYRRHTAKVTRWQSETNQISRWTATALLKAEEGFRRLKGYAELPKLIAASPCPPGPLTPIRAIDPFVFRPTPAVSFMLLSSASANASQLYLSIQPRQCPCQSTHPQVLSLRRHPPGPFNGTWGIPYPGAAGGVDGSGLGVVGCWFA